MKIHFLLLIFFYFSIPLHAKDKKIFINNSRLEFTQSKFISRDSTLKQLYRHKFNINFIGKVGLNWSNTNFNRGYPSPVAPVETTWKGGLTLGLGFIIYFGNKFSIQQEYLYSQRGGYINNLSVGYKLDYLSMPFLVNYKINRFITIKAGTQFDLLIDANQMINNQYINIIHETEARNIGLIGGLNLKLIKSLNVDFRYMDGYNNITIKQQINSKEFKYESLQLTFDYIF